MLSSSRLRRSSVALVPALLLASLAACGTKVGYGDSTASGLDSFSVGGAFGKAPTITWNAQPDYPTSVQTKTLVKGTGPAVTSSDPLQVNIYISDPIDDAYKARTACHASASESASADSTSAAASGSAAGDAAGSGAAGASKSRAPKASKSKAPAAATTPAAPSAPAAPSSSAAPTPVTMTPCPDTVSYPLKGGWVYQSQQPESMTLSQVSPIFQQALNGATIGSRVEVLAGSPAIFPAQQGGAAGSPQLGVGTQDPVVMVLDVLKKSAKPLTGPKGTPEKAPSWAPKVKVDSKQNPTGLDFSGLAKPKANGKLMKAILIKGTGAKVKATDTITANYYGMVYGAKKPFDESYTKQPLTSALSGLVPGWQQGLAGIPVGSRVLLQIPPALGYGSKAQKGIPANSTLYFVLDVLAAN